MMEVIVLFLFIPLSFVFLCDYAPFLTERTYSIIISESDTLKTRTTLHVAR